MDEPNRHREPGPNQGARATVLVAVFIGCFGGCDAARAFEEMGEVVVDQPELPDIARAQAMQQAIVLLSEDPHRRAVSAAHFGVALLLILGAPMLFRRKSFGGWWVRNLAIANVLVLGVGLATTYMHYQSVAPQVDALFSALPPNPEAPPFGAMVSFRVVAFGEAIRIAVYAYFGWRVSQPDVRAELS